MLWRSQPGAIKIAAPHPRVTAMGLVALFSILGTGWLFFEADNVAVLVAGTMLLTAGLVYGWRLGVVFDDDGVTIFWALAVVPHEGRPVMASGTAAKRARQKTLLAIQQASVRYAVPSNVTGTMPDRETAAAP